MFEKHGPIKLPTKYGMFEVAGYTFGQITHLTLTHNLHKNRGEVLVRIQSACRFGETFHSLDCDCGPQLQKSMQLISNEGTGIIIYLEQEGRGAGIEFKLDAMRLEQERSIDTVEAFQILGLKEDIRSYDFAIEILRDLGISELRLLTNNPRKIQPLINSGIRAKSQSLEIEPNEYSKGYLRTKRDKLGHNLMLIKEQRK
jgi:3,4-dihydroxy 2-butanone 4-phosphate synthase / GTP cyclohydrolase II